MWVLCARCSLRWVHHGNSFPTNKIKPTERSQYTALRALLFYMLDYYLCILECSVCVSRVCVCVYLSYLLVLFALIKCGLDAVGLSILFPLFSLALFFAFGCFMFLFLILIHPPVCCGCGCWWWCCCYCYRCFYFFFLLRLPSIILMVFWPPTFTAHRGRKTLKRVSEME